MLKERYQVKYLVIGCDHRFGRNRNEGSKDYVHYGREIGVGVIRAKAYINNIGIGNESSVLVNSPLVRKLFHGKEVDLAVHCLKYEYFPGGVVVDDYQVDRRIDFPITDLRVDGPDKLISADGVYTV